MKRFMLMALAVMMVAGSMSCTMTRAQKGAIFGGAGGAAVGGMIGKQTGNTATGAIIGAAVGGAAGAVIGNYMDKQAEELAAEMEGADVERVGEGIQVTLASGILFDVNKSDLRPAAQESLRSFAEVLNRYPDTNILIAGHTDSDGSESHNQQLSERRAQAVYHYLVRNAVAATRIGTVGYGESQPVADNSTVAGKQANRRVEVAIMANEELKKSAESQSN
ncbi:MAG: OmpA family protein [bacterium]|nr:OmpA family protein [bacterium]